MKLFWTGTDSLMLIDYSMRKLRKKPYWFVFRILIRIIDNFIECHYCDSENVADNLRKFGVKNKIEVFRDKLKHNKQYPKKSHKGFNVIYYRPQGGDRHFRKWLYGFDLIDEAKQKLPHINFIELDGSRDMKQIYPITDFMLRPNRHDGSSRIRQECDIQKIPYYWTFKNPDINDIIKAIENEFNNKQKSRI